MQVPKFDGNHTGMLPSAWERSAFGIPEATRAVSAVRFSLALTVLVWVLAGPFPAFYPEEELLLYAPSGLGVLIPALGTSGFISMKAAVALACLGMFWRRTALTATRIAAATFALLNGYVAGFGELWNYNTHLNIFLIALAFSPRAGVSASASTQRCSAILYFMRVQVAMFYFQAGLAKLVHGGLDWPQLTPYVHLVLQEGWLAPWLIPQPTIVTAGATVIIVIELLLPLLLLVRRTQVLGAALATGLHLCLFITLGISFWHLWVLFPALFMVRSPVAAVRSVPKV